MSDSSAEHALQAILALGPEASSALDEGARAFATAPLPTLDARVEMYLRAMRDGDSGAEDPARARELILSAMALDLAEGSEQNGEDFGPARLEAPKTRFDRARRPARSGFRGAVSVRSNRSVRRISGLAATIAALLVVGWSGAWLYALNSLSTTIAEWREWEGKSGRRYSCATESFGGSPVRVEMVCGGFEAAIVTGHRKYAAEARQLRVVVDLLHPGVIVTKVEGPVSFAELGGPDRFTGSWSRAEAIVTGPNPTPDGVSIELADFKLDRVSREVSEPLAIAGHVAFRARLDPIATAATKKAAYDLTSDVTAGSWPSGPPMAARPFEARVKAVLHGVGDMTPKPLPERIKGWQRNGGLVEMTSIEIHGSSADAKAQGTIALSDRGGIEGLLELSGADYDRLFEVLTGTNPASRMADEKANVPSTTRKLPALRFVDGAAYFGSKSLGRLPALF